LFGSKIGLILYPHTAAILKLFFTLLILFFVFPVFSQDTLRIEHGRDYDDSLVQPFMSSLNSENDFVVAFRAFYPGKSARVSEYFVLTGRGGQLKAYVYSGINGRLKGLNLLPGSLDQIWKTFQQNDLFRIRNEKDIPNFCAKKYDIYESHTYEFTILSKSRMKVLSYYSPEYYIEACYGISERQNIINSVAVIDLLRPEN